MQKSIYTNSNPLYVQLLEKRNQALNQRNKLEKEILGLPSAEQEYVDLYRQLEISEDLYTQLVNQKLSLSIVEASTIGNIRVVDSAYVKAQVSPKGITYLIYLFIYAALVAIVFIIRGLYFLPISNPAELEDNGIDLNILGVIPFIDDMNKNDNDKNRLDQAVESSIISINSLIKQKNISNKVILITSPTWKWKILCCNEYC